MLLSVNGLEVFNTIYVPEQEEFNITCHALLARPAANLTWIINGLSINQSFTIDPPAKPMCPSDSFNTTSTMSYFVDEDQETISCIGTQDIHSKQAANVTVITYVMPSTFLSFNGTNVSKELTYVAENSDEIITCHVIDSRPTFNLTWMINQKVAKPQNYETINYQKFGNRSDSISRLHFRAEKVYQSVSCITTYEAANVTSAVSAEFFTYVPPSSKYLLINGRANSLGTIYVDQTEVIICTCNALGARPKVDFAWKIDERPVESGMIVDSSFPQQRNTFYSTSTLKLVETVKENITVTCIIRLKVAAMEQVIIGTISTYVKPTVFLSINGREVVDFIYVPGVVDVNISCYATGARPAAEITWLLNGESVSSENFRTVVKPTQENRTDSSSVFQFQAEKDNDTVTCSSRLDRAGITQNTTGKVVIYVIPRLTLLLNGRNSTNGTVNITRSEGINASCYTLGGKPAVNLSWLINNKKMDNLDKQVKMSFKKTKAENNTFHSFSTIQFKPQGKQGSVTCVMSSVTGHEAQLERKFLIIDGNFKPAWIVLCVIVGFTAVLAYGSYYIKNKLKDARELSLGRNE
ncbi:hypothetical protein HOLleu_25256 [Holothuria leucospilota]|uniref:Ig-like domain-containing protein n=1 Tax=Holothuria leucospilota TaxID=206669 RepID=A0A9Q1BSL3_HOLLE|nr:hypothetical protein HOLleu_25256 [Holothuria leucospilota]